MIYSNADFAVFLVATLALYNLVPLHEMRFIVLLCSSLFFYSWAGLFDTLIFLSVVAVSWLATAMAYKYPRKRKSFLAAGIIVMAAHLGFWKYAPWICGEIQRLYPSFLGGTKLTLPLPVGISFFTLQGIAYLVDFARGEASFLRFPEYMLFKSFFPQLVAGPIVRVHQLLPQLKKLHRSRLDDLSVGISLFAQGFVKKLLIADKVAPYVDEVFRNPSLFGRNALILSLLGYTLQIWADFSGYTDMGRGTARMFGITLPENFLSPYLSRSPSEFWRRWHITLSQWIRDYIYIPMGGQKGSFVRVASVAFLTMCISGLWHGANWTFLLWGIYHGLLLVLERLIKKSKLALMFNISFPKTIRFCLSWFLMFPLICYGWLIFRSESLGALGAFSRGIVANMSGTTPQASAKYIYSGAIICLVFQIISYFDFAQKRFTVIESLSRFTFKIAANRRQERTLELAYHFCLGIVIAVSMAVSVFFRAGQQSGAFIYFQF